jgi:RHS repeat-associated protein
LRSHSFRKAACSLPLLLALGYPLLVAPEAAAQTPTLIAVADSYLKGGSANQNQGADTLLRIQSSGPNRALLRFDPAAITSAVGSGHLASARLELYLPNSGNNWGTAGRTVDAHRLTADWTESGVTWNCGIDSIPTNSQPNCAATWSGGTYAEEPTDTVMHTNGFSGWVSFDVTADVAAYLAGTPNFGWVVKKSDESQSGQADYTSREGAAGQRPRLVLIAESAAFDQVPPALMIAAPGGEVVVNDPTPEIRLEFADFGTGINTGLLAVTLDGADLRSRCSLTVISAVCEPAPLAPGMHSIAASIADFAGNVATAAHSFELLSGPGLHQATFTAAADTYLRSGSANQAQGSESLLRIRASGHNRALVRFDSAAIAAALAGVTVRSAALELAIQNNGDNWGKSGRSVDLHRLAASWVESTATWNCANDLDPANQQPDCAAQWAGGAYAAAPSATLTVSNGQRGTLRFDVTADLAAMLAGSADNGWLLRKSDEGASGLVDLRSREDATGPAPLLVVVFETETPADTAPPVISGRTPAPGSFALSGTTPVTADFSDDASGIDTASVRLTVDDADRTAEAMVDANVLRWTPTVPLAEGQHGVHVDVRDLAGNPVTASWQFTVDFLPPTLEIVAPGGDLLTGDPIVVVQLSYGDLTSGVAFATLEVRVDGAPITGSCNVASRLATCTTPALANGSHLIEASLRDVASNLATASRSFLLTLDLAAPALTMLAPADGIVVGASPVGVTGLVGDDSAVEQLTVNGIVATLALPQFSATVPLVEGLNTLLVVATDAFGRSTSTSLAVTLDTGAPTIAGQVPAPGSEVESDTPTVSATFSDDGSGVDPATVQLTIDGIDRTADAQITPTRLSWSASEPLAAGLHTAEIALADRGGNAMQANWSFSIVLPEPLPPDPVTIAPTYTEASATDLFASSSFLWTSSTPVQLGVAPGAIEPERITLLRGRVLGPDGQPLAGVRVSVHDHPELGHTQSREDGVYDLAANGGAKVTLVFEKSSYLTSYRSIEAEAQEFGDLPEVVLIQLDPAASSITAGLTEMQVARGSLVTDEDGSRRATILFPGGTTATMQLPGGSSAPLLAMTVRATEYTVGPLGPQQMPAELPENTGYTYAVELSIDEAMAAQAESVTFSQPVVVYVDNFVHFPVGETVPQGSFDRQRALWIPEPNGRIVEILSIAGGMAELDVDGSGNPADAEVLATLGISDDERTRLATLYPVGATLWRVPTTHFTVFDYNWPWGPPFPWIWPQPAPDPKPGPGGIPGTTPPPPGSAGDSNGGSNQEDGETNCGSIIDCSNRALRERIDLVGAPFSLYWASDRVKGAPAATKLDIPLTDSSLPSTVTKVTLNVSIRGWYSKQEFAPAPDLVATITWPTVDRWLRSYPIDTPVKTEVCYSYKAAYYSSPKALDSSFSTGTGGGGAGSSSSAPSSGRFLAVGPRNAADILICRSSFTEIGRLARPSLGGWDASAAGLGGWSIDVQHRYNPLTGTLFLGDGTRHLVKPFDTGVRTFAGTGQSGSTGDGGLAKNARVSFVNDIAFGPDGSVYLADSDAQRIRRVSRTGVITTVAGDGANCSAMGCGDGGPATAAQLSFPQSVAVTPDGSLLIGDDGCIRKVDPAGVISTLFGDCYQGPNQVSSPTDLLLGPGGGLYIADNDWNQVFYLGAEGRLSAVAGNTSCNSTVEDQPALDTAICSPGGLALDNNGDLLIAGGYSEMVLRLRDDGTLERVAGTGDSGLSGDGGPATSAKLNAVNGIAARPDGSLYLADTFNGLVRKVSSNGLIFPVTGGWSGIPLVEGMPPQRLFIGYAEKVAVAPDGRIFVSDTWDPRVLVIGEADPFQVPDGYLIPSEDGSQAYLFDLAGIHRKTYDALTGATLLTFAYDSANRLVSVTDVDANVTTLERAPNGAAEAIVGPYGQRTEIALDFAGYLASATNPAGEATSMTYTGLGLLATFRNPRGSTSTMQFDADGKLLRDTNVLGGFTNVTGNTNSANGSKWTTHSVTTAMGTSKTVAHQVDSQNDVRWVSRSFGTDTATIREWRQSNGGTRRDSPDGSRVDTTVLADPVWGSLVRIPDASTVTTPANLGPTTTTSVVANLSNGLDPLSLTDRTTDVRVNNKLYRARFDRTQGLWTFTSPVGRVSTLAVDAAGRPVTSQVGSLEPVHYAYDTRGRLQSILQGTGIAEREVDFDYDSSGRLAIVTDPLSRQVTFDYDDANRVTSQDLPGGRTVLFGWDANGNLTSLTPPGRPAHLFNYTAVDLVSSYGPPTVAGGGSTGYSWNLDKKPTTITRPDGATISFGYDPGQRPTSITSLRGTQTITWEPNKARVQRLTTPEGVLLDYLYDGPLVTRTTWSGTSVAGQVNRTYDDDLRLKTVAVNGANAITYTYDNDSLITQAGSLILTRSPSTGLLTGTTLGSVTTSYTYSSFGELASMTAKFSTTTLYAETHSRDKLGRITTKVETIQGTTTTYDYGYDTAGRLETVKKNGVLSATYSYDLNGNRLSKVTPATTETGTYDDQDRTLSYGGANYTYAANGELLTKVDATGSTTYQFDVSGNLLRVTLPNGTQVTYKVDGRNRRIERAINGVVSQRFLWQGRLSPVAELNSSNAVVSRFVYATRANVPDYITKSGVSYRVVTNHLGSPRLIVNTSTGAVAQRLDYDEWGAVINDTSPGFQPFGFTGGVYDPATKLLRLGARDFSSAKGRFERKEPLGFGGGSSNLYEYARNNPLSFEDLDGRFVVVDDAAALAVGVGLLVVSSAIVTSPEYQEWVHDQVHALQDWIRDLPPFSHAQPTDLGVSVPLEYQWPKSYPSSPGKRGPSPGKACPVPSPDPPFPEIASPNDPRQPPMPEEVFKESLDKRKKALLDLLGDGLDEVSGDLDIPH